jgi:hypothetical protein
MIAHPEVQADVGRTALQRGPIVYCFEGVDHDERVFDLALPRSAEIQAEFKPGLLGGIVMIKAKGLRTAEADWKDKLYQPAVDPQPVEITGVPYYAWDHRGDGQMTVWITDGVCP